MNHFKKLRPLVQLVPAAVVAAMLLATVPNTAPVLAAVPERLTLPSASETAAEEETAKETETLPALPYADGVYVGSSRGYGGPVKVQVTMRDGSITGLQLLDASHETSNFLKRAKRLLPMVLEAQTWEVDAVSEATYTSRGILGAIQNALTGEEVINPAPPQPKPATPLVVEEFVAPSTYRDGVYTASAQGFGGPITVQVTIQNDAIADITLVSHEGETTSYFSRARKVIPAILESGSPDVDAVSGATYSSTGILNAVKNALSKAAGDDPEPLESELPAESETTSEVPELPSEEVLAEEPASPSEAAPAPASDAQSRPSRFWEQAREQLHALFSGSKQDTSSTVVFRPEESAVPSEDASAPEEASSELAPASISAETEMPAETEEREE